MSELRLFTPISSNKNKHEFDKNLKVMTSTINAQLPKKFIDVMEFVEMRPTPPLEMGSETCQRANGAFGHSKEPRLKIFSKTYRIAKSKETS